MKNTDFKYGKTVCTAQIPDTADSLTIREPLRNIDREKFIADLLLKLPGDLSSNTSIGIVIADKTRLCGYKTYLPWIVEPLLEKGIKKQGIQFFIAYGTHAEQSDKECLKAYGDLYHTFHFIHHDALDQKLFTCLVKTFTGTGIHIRKDILKKDLIITFGALSHHYFAGYGGGRKLLFPGLGYQPDIYRNHALFLDKKLKKLHPGCFPGNLENNPLAEDLKKIDSLNKINKINIHGILDSKGKVCRLITGKTYTDFLKACKILDKYYKAQNQNQYKLVIASCGGFPKDINFIQAHKAVNNAAMFVKDRGSLVMVAECMEGIGSNSFLEYFNFGGFSKAFKILSKTYKGNGGTALSMMTKTKRINIFLKTALDDKICRSIGVKKIDDTRMQQLINNNGSDMAYIKNAGLLIR